MDSRVLPVVRRTSVAVLFTLASLPRWAADPSTRREFGRRNQWVLPRSVGAPLNPRACTLVAALFTLVNLPRLAAVRFIRLRPACTLVVAPSIRAVLRQSVVGLLRRPDTILVVVRSIPVVLVVRLASAAVLFIPLILATANLLLLRLVVNRNIQSRCLPAQPCPRM